MSPFWNTKQLNQHFINEAALGNPAQLGQLAVPEELGILSRGHSLPPEHTSVLVGDVRMRNGRGYHYLGIHTCSLLPVMEFL